MTTLVKSLSFTVSTAVSTAAALGLISTVALSVAKADTKTAPAASAGPKAGLAAAADGAAMKPTEAQISAIMTTANEGEIKAAKLAEKKGVDKEVKDFASMMIKEHTKNIEDEKALVKKMNLKPDASTPVVADLKKTSASQEAELNKMKGPEFDKTYINQQVAAHTTLLDDLNSKLIPSAQNTDLKNYLENTKSHVEAHLVRARNIQTRLTR